MSIGENLKITSILAEVDLRGCPDEYKSTVYRAAVTYWHELGMEPNIIPPNETKSTLGIEIDPEGHDVDDIKNLCREWGHFMSRKCSELSGQDIGHYEEFMDSDPDDNWGVPCKG